MHRERAEEARAWRETGSQAAAACAAQGDRLDCEPDWGDELAAEREYRAAEGLPEPTSEEIAEWKAAATEGWRAFARARDAEEAPEDNAEENGRKP